MYIDPPCEEHEAPDSQTAFEAPGQECHAEDAKWSQTVFLYLKASPLSHLPLTFYGHIRNLTQTHTL